MVVKTAASPTDNLPSMYKVTMFRGALQQGAHEILWQLATGRCTRQLLRPLPAASFHGGVRRFDDVEFPTRIDMFSVLWRMARQA